ncbi:MAG: type III-A CRISPR-associated RAMP protein Csm3 [Leptolyngbya sp. UWPOB_LEPTO1]|uniref:type III-A CRISPR-associated RAMP protein Csm3 n=1 Tax=Leptolyngbya sp. UWPOB_LEPTO1 TaxID=2815653 RepID=UPI001AC60A06|nr:type III-A CRISPR-associated RAMP protein Csm3 [Leptolyngbya sp. UWPOB_LEPTO1]MBN8563484.1 type III-A CRISPR-associated RAMP protein Csm3 [Leptolyngbya sp. UWPOB_LEPTO1]
MTATTTEQTQTLLLGKIRIESTLFIKTGLHIGGGNETLDIGGLDKPVIRDPITRYPYLPGSSIKGKLRSILERSLNRPLNRRGSRDTYRYESDDLVDGITELDGHYIRFAGARNCPVSRIFGSTGVKCWVKVESAEDEKLLDKDQQGNIRNRTQQIDGEPYAWVDGRNCPSRLIVRDSHLETSSAQELEEVDTGLYMTEWKFENGIDRITAAANPRQVERVPKGARFHFEMIYTVEDSSQVAEDLKNLAFALAVLEDDALGGHGSRGYGKVQFTDIKLFCKNREQYYNPTDSGDQPFKTYATITDLLKQFGGLVEEVRSLLPGS